MAMEPSNLHRNGKPAIAVAHLILTPHNLASNVTVTVTLVLTFTTSAHSGNDRARAETLGD